MTSRHMAAATACAALLTSACATTTDRGNGMPGGDTGEMAQCDATAARSLIGTQADAAIGAKILALTGSRSLRWAPPNSALTMDYRPDRVTVSYDDTMTIDRITCG